MGVCIFQNSQNCTLRIYAFHCLCQLSQETSKQILNSSYILALHSSIG